jgi:uncharacterized ion transporter superfamily protein YfcC
MVEKFDMATQTHPKKTKKVNPPHTYIIIFAILLLAFTFTYLVPVGSYTYHDLEVTVNGETQTKSVIDPNSFQYELDEHGNPMRLGAPVFSDYFVTDRTGFFNYVFDGMTSGGAEGTVGVMVFIIIIGGTFGIILRTGAMDQAIYAVIRKTKGKDIFLVPALFIIFSLAGAIFGFNDESIAFCMVTVPLFVTLGYDAVTAIMTTFVASQVGFGTSWMNPFSVGIAQGIAELPLLSATPFRVVLWLIMTFIGVVYTTRYAMKVKKNPEISISYLSDNRYREVEGEINEQEKELNTFSMGHKLVLVVFGLGMVWVIWGVMKNQWYISQMATQFFIIGLIAGVVALISKLDNFKTLNDIPIAFGKGVEDFASILAVIGMAKGVILILGGTDLAQPSVMNTLLHYASNILVGVSSTISAWGMFVFQCVFNIFVSSATAQAAISMPIMTPLADLLGVNRQIAVLAFQMGDSFTDTINPIAPILMAVIGVGGIDYWSWLKWQAKFATILFVCGSIAMFIAVAINLS